MLFRSESGIERLPLVRLVYNATKDLIGAFVGEKKRFDKPVVVSLTADGAVRGLGFITQESLEQLGSLDAVVVYFPQSYAFAGWTFIVPVARVQRHLVQEEGRDVVLVRLERREAGGHRLLAATPHHVVGRGPQHPQPVVRLPVARRGGGRKSVHECSQRHCPP